MLSQTEIAVALFAMFGGLGINLLRLVEEHHTMTKRQKKDGEVPYLSDPLSALQFIVIPLLGAGLALAYQTSGTPLTPLLAVNIGACAPVIFKTLSNQVPSRQESVDRREPLPVSTQT
jgi:hypothetical protein